MPEFFGPVALPQWNQLNQFYNPDVSAIRHNQALTGSQDLEDRATARGLAPALAGSIDPQTGLVGGRDLNALATMATLPGSVPGYNALSEGDARNAASKLQLMTFDMARPRMPYGPGGTAALAVGGPATTAPAAPAGDDQFINALAPSEAPSASTVNKGGYNGQYQFGAPRLTDLRVYTPADGEIVQGERWNGKTEGTFHIPGFPDVKTKAEFLRNAEAQRAVMHLQVNDLRKVIQSTPGAENFDPTGLLAVGHLGGPTGMVRFIQSNGAYNPGDNPKAPGGGTHLMDYYTRFSKGGPVALQQAYGHPQGPLPADHPAMPLLASNAGAAGMPAVATDAAGSATLGPQSAPPSATSATAPATPDATAALVNGWRQQGAALPPDQRVAVDPSYLANRNAPMEQPGVPLAPQGLQPAPASVAPPVPVQAAGLQQPAPASVAPPASTQAPQSVGWQPTIPPGARPITDGRNIPLPVPGSPGFTQYQLPNGQVVPVRTTPPKLEIKDAGPLRSFIDPDSGRTLRTEVIPDHSRMQVIQGPNGPQLWQSGQKVTELPATTRPEQAKLLNEDYKQIATLGQQARDFDQQIQKAVEARNYAAGLPTGAGFESRQAAANFLETYWPEAGKTLREKLGTLLPDAAQAQSAAKLLLSQAQAEEKAMGGSGGLGLTQMYASANPNLSMQPQAIREMSNLKAVTALSGQDYVQGKIDHVTTHGDEFLNQNGHYVPAAAYDKAWFSQNNRNVYMAAINAINGKPYAEWSKGLQPDEAARALGVVARIDPTGSVSGRNGHPLAVQQFLPVNSTNPGGATVH